MPIALCPPPCSVGLAEAYLSEQFHPDTCRYFPKHDGSKICNQFADTKNVLVLPLSDMVFWLSFLWICSILSMKIFCRLEVYNVHHFAKNAELPIRTHFFLLVCYSCQGRPSKCSLADMLSFSADSISIPW